jgi:hypothetical protein
MKKSNLKKIVLKFNKYTRSLSGTLISFDWIVSGLIASVEYEDIETRTFSLSETLLNHLNCIFGFGKLQLFQCFF